MPPKPRYKKRPPAPAAQPQTDEDRKRLYRDRAKRWGYGVTPWMAEWFEKGVEYCLSNPVGRAGFETWIRKDYPAAEAEQIITDCRKRTGSHPVALSQSKLHTDTDRIAMELGITEMAFRLYHQYSGYYTEPLRVEPAVKRRRGEPSSEWVLRRTDAMVAGCKVPNIDWEECRRIALSEYDATKDLYEAWHVNFEMFIEGIISRGSSTISYLLKPSDPDAPENVLQNLVDAFRTRLIFIHIAHAHWSRAAELFEDLARRGLTTTSRIERAYRADPRLKWRLVSCAALSSKHASRASEQARQVWASQPSFKHYFKRYRSTDGRAHIEINMPYVRAHPPPPATESIDRLIISACTIHSKAAIIQTAARTLEEIRKRPHEDKKFTDYAWKEVGDYYSTSTFYFEFCESEFGKTLSKYAEELPDSEVAIFNEEVVFTNQAKIFDSSYKSDHKNEHFARAADIIDAVTDRWISAIFDPGLGGLDPQQFLWNVINLSVLSEEKKKDPTVQQIQRELFPFFDHIWEMTDKWCWDRAREFDPPGRPGFLAKTFGIYDPRKPRPTFREHFFLRRLAANAEIKPNTTPAPAPVPTEFVSSIPIAGPSDSAAQSAHSYLASQQETSKVKTKTRNEPSAQVTAAMEDMSLQEDAEDEAGPEIPDALPTTFKIGRKTLKIFHRILEDDTEDDLRPDAPKKGQVRWNDFERAMKRIGFDVIQTAGSSVRFDPAAKTARPITFHRPHPEAILANQHIKWVGARLKRCYGWTTSSFLQGDGE